MPQRYFQNDAAHTVFIGGVMVPPGEGRMVDALSLPAEEAAPAATDAPADGAGDDGDGDGLPADDAAALALPLRTLIPLLAAAPDERLLALSAGEEASATPRKGLLTAIAELRMLRAQDRSGGAPT